MGTILFRFAVPCMTLPASCPGGVAAKLAVETIQVNAVYRAAVAAKEVRLKAIRSNSVGMLW